MEKEKKFHMALEALNKYDYQMDKSAQAALWLIRTMESIFGEKQA